MNPANSSGELDKGSNPIFLMLSLTSAFEAMSTHSALRRSMMARGVPAGAREGHGNSAPSLL
jgi:hypothetical protein